MRYRITQKMLIILIGIFSLLFTAPAFAKFADHFDEPNDIGENKMPRSGTPNVLVALVNIKTSYTVDWTRWTRFFSDANSCGTFNHYYTTASLGQYSPVPKAVGPFDVNSCPVPLTNGYCYIA